MFVPEFGVTVELGEQIDKFQTDVAEAIIERFPNCDRVRCIDLLSIVLASDSNLGRYQDTLLKQIGRRLYSGELPLEPTLEEKKEDILICLSSLSLSKAQQLLSPSIRLGKKEKEPGIYVTLTNKTNKSTVSKVFKNPRISKEGKEQTLFLTDADLLKKVEKESTPFVEKKSDDGSKQYLIAPKDIKWGNVEQVLKWIKLLLEGRVSFEKNDNSWYISPEMASIAVGILVFEQSRSLEPEIVLERIRNGEEKKRFAEREEKKQLETRVEELEKTASEMELLKQQLEQERAARKELEEKCHRLEKQVSLCKAQIQISENKLQEIDRNELRRAILFPLYHGFVNHLDQIADRVCINKKFAETAYKVGEYGDLLADQVPFELSANIVKQAERTLSPVFRLMVGCQPDNKSGFLYSEDFTPLIVWIFKLIYNSPSGEKTGDAAIDHPSILGNLTPKGMVRDASENGLRQHERKALEQLKQHGFIH